MSNWFNGSFQWISDYCRTIKRLFIDPIVLIQGFQSSLNLLFGNPTNKDLTNLAQANLVISRTIWNQDDSTLLGFGKSIRVEQINRQTDHLNQLETRAKRWPRKSDFSENFSSFTRSEITASDWLKKTQKSRFAQNTYFRFSAQNSLEKTFKQTKY